MKRKFLGHTIFSGDLAGLWSIGLRAGHQGPCETLDETAVFSSNSLPVGRYLFIFALDMDMDGLPDLGQFHCDILRFAVLP